jgi:uncharacterized protein (DUF2235 family)
VARNLVFCFDGTWNSLSATDPTNVVLTAEMVAPIHKGVSQLVYYDEGLGTSRLSPLVRTYDKFLGGAFGRGIRDKLRLAYRFLILNYHPGDDIYAFGFSRGAYTARSFLGLIRHAAILDAINAGRIDDAISIYFDEARRHDREKPSEDSAAAIAFRARYAPQICVSEDDLAWRRRDFPDLVGKDPPLLSIKYLGLWDTVAAVGLPEVLPGAKAYNRNNHAHDVRLTSKVDSARHALAVDERRRLFAPVQFSNINSLNERRGFAPGSIDAPYQQRWFPGTHGSVGGGGPERGLSDGALLWILDGARAAGLGVRTEPAGRAIQIAPHAFGPLANSNIVPMTQRGPWAPLYRAVLMRDRAGPTDIADVSAAARKRWYAKADELPEKRLYRPKTLAGMSTALSHEAVETKAARVHAVQPGDTLSRIAEQQLGDPRRYREIFDLNRDVLDSPHAITPGMKLYLPAT